MLVLSRKPTQSVLLEVPGLDQPLRVLVVNVRGERARLAFDAPPAVIIRRAELPPLIPAAPPPVLAGPALPLVAEAACEVA